MLRTQLKTNCSIAHSQGNSCQNTWHPRSTKNLILLLLLEYLMNIDECFEYKRPGFSILSTFITFVFTKKDQDEGSYTVTSICLYWHRCCSSFSRREILLWKKFVEGLGITLRERNADKEIRALQWYDAASTGGQLPLAMDHPASRT